MLNLDRVRKIKKGEFGLTTPQLQYDYTSGSFVQQGQNWKDKLNNQFFLDSQNQPNPYMNGDSKAKSFLSSGNLGNMIGQGSDFLSGLFSGSKDGYQGKYGSLQQTSDQLFDQASNTMMSINPLVGGIMKAGGLVSDVLTSFGGMGTDSMTKTDALLGSKLLSLTPFGMINGFFGKRTQDFATDTETIEQVGGSYGGTVDLINDAQSKANKKYGLFSGKARRKANRLITDARNKQNIMADIAQDASDRQSIATNMSQLNNLRYNINQNGGIDQRYLLSAKQGDKIQRIKKLQLHKVGGIIKQSINVDTKEIEEWSPTITECFEEGGTIEWQPTIELMQEGGEINKQRTLAELIEYAKQQNPRFIQRLSESPKGIDFIDDEGKQSRGSHYLEWGTDDKGNAIVYPRIQEVDGQLKFFNHTDAYNRAIENNNYLIMTPDEAKIFFAEDSKYGTAYKSGWPEFFKSFKNGGKTEELESPKIEETNQKNIIPEGALHARKHNMENAENLTKKGIPVIDNEGEQQAEIEKNEIIFTLEVTKKLEELMKDGSDEAAIEAGKLLVKEILFNTDDRTGLIGTLGKGGVIDVVS